MLISANSGMYSSRANDRRLDMVNDTVDMLTDCGFEAIDINFCATVRDIEAVGNKARETILDQPDGLDRLEKKLKERKISYSTCHLPFYNYFMENEEEKIRLFDEGTKKAINAAGRLGLKWAVIHSAPEVDQICDFVRPYAELATPQGVGIAIENIRIVPVEVTRDAIDKLASEGFIVGNCFDTGHSNFAGDVVADDIRILGKRIKMLHVHDNYGDRDAHQPPFSGNIDWKSVIGALREVGYEGDFNYEVSTTNIPMPAKPKYLKYLAELARALTDL